MKGSPGEVIQRDFLLLLNNNLSSILNIIQKIRIVRDLVENIRRNIGLFQ